MPNVDLSTEELEHLAGDPPDGPGGVGRVGLFDLTKNAYRVRVRYADKVVECEVFVPKDAPITVHWLCPNCGPSNSGTMSTIRGDQKHIEFDPHAQVEDGGRLNVEAFECPWELENKGRRMDFGLSLCRLRLVIDNSRARKV